MPEKEKDAISELRRRVEELEGFRKRFQQTEEKLRDSENRYQTLLQTIPDIVYVIDANGRFTFLNKAVCCLGYEPDELIGKHFSTIIHQDDLLKVSRQSVLPCFAGKTTGPRQAPGLFDERRTGDRRTTDLEVRVLTRASVAPGTEANDSIFSLVCASGHYQNGEENDSRTFVGTIGVMRDITSRKRDEKTLREREAFNYALFEYNPIETVVVDLEGRITRFNLAKKKSGSRLPRIGDVMYRDYAAKHEIDLHAELRDCITTKELRHFPELRYGNHVLAVTISPFGQGAIITSQNITSRKRTEEALRESERRFRETADLLPTLVCELNLDRVMTYVNKTGRELLGYTQEEIGRGISLYDILQSEDQERAERKTDQVLQGKTTDASEFKAITRGGQELALLINFSAIRRQNEVIGFRTSGMNVTFLKEMEKELQRAQILESLGILAGGIGHDFNNILAGIVGNVQLAKKKLERGQSADSYLQGIQKATERAVSLSRQLLTFSKGGAPVKKIAPIGELLKETAGFALRGSHVGCSFAIGDQLWPCHIDQGQISQVINNLVINAGQSMPHGGTVQIKADNHKVDDDTGLPLNPGPYVRIGVGDQGVGIAPENMGKVFEPYFTTKDKGSGLGLAVSYSIVNKHGGHITLHSKLNEGTTFTVYLPASQDTLSRSSSSQSQPTAGSGRILLMDDDDIVREVGSESLQELGYDVALAEHGKMALDIYREASRIGRPFAAVILDLTVPGGMGGKETLENLRAFDASVRAIVSSGYSDDPVMAEPQKYGFSGVIRKPYDIDDLAMVLLDVITQRK